MGLSGSDTQSFPSLYSHISNNSTACAEVTRQMVAGFSRRLAHGFALEEAWPSIGITWLASQRLEECPHEHQVWVAQYRIMMLAYMINSTPMLASFGFVVLAGSAMVASVVAGYRRFVSSYFN